MSDVAYAKNLILNSHDIWKEELEVRWLRVTMVKNEENAEQIGKYFTYLIKKKVLGREPKVAEYKRRRGESGKYLGHGWNKEGINLSLKNDKEHIVLGQNKISLGTVYR